MATIRIKQCRICRNKKLIKIGSLGKIAISDFTTELSEGHRLPLELVYCQKCTLLQLAHNFDRSLLYKNYWYESHINPTIVNDLKGIAKYSKGKLAHIDIGGNDGTMLKYSRAKQKYCVDPSNIKPDHFNWLNAYWEDVTILNPSELITAIACIYDLPDPNKFMRKIKEALTSNGIFIAQLMTLQPFIENNDVGNICHEHLEFYSYKSLVTLYEQNGLEIFKVEENSINGGSYRIFARHYKKGSIKFKEKTYGVREFKAFFKRIEKNKKDLFSFIRNELQRDGVIYGYGASTKANTILQYYGITHITLIDINPNKLGKYAITQELPIIDKIPKDATCLWVFPYGFLKGFKKREKGYKGKWVTTIPTFKIL